MHVNGIIDFGADDGTDINYVSTGAAKYNDGQWHHVAVAVDATDVILYIDGAQVDSTGHGDSFYSNSAKWRLGARNDDSEYFNGGMDDARIYSRALSADEITQLYNMGGSKIGKTNTPTGLASGLVGHWTFDGPDMDWGSTTAEVQDVSGQGNDGNATTTMSPAANTSLGKIGQALLLDGVDDGIYMGDVHDFANADSFTLAAWVKLGAGSGNEMIVGKRKILSPYSGYRLHINGSNEISWDIGGTTNGRTAIIKTVATYAGYTDWMYVVATYGGTGSTDDMDLYIDGVNAAITVVDNDLLGSIEHDIDFTIGTREGSNVLDGAVDDVRVYDRVLSAEEVAQLYNMSGSKVGKTNTPTGLSSGLIGHWTFDGPDMTTATATDSSGTGNDGTLKNSPQVLVGTIGQALKFDGVNMSIDVKDHASLGITGDVTIAAWVKSDALPPSGVDVIMTKQGNSGNPASPYQLAIKDNGQLRWYHAVQGGTPSEIIDSTDAITAGEWYHVAAVRDVGNNLKYYINGVADSSNPYAATVTPEDYAIDLRIARHNTDDREFDGGLDDVRLYNRALSADEITQLYNLGR